MKHSNAARRAERLAKQERQQELRRQEKRRAKAERRVARRAEQPVLVGSGAPLAAVAADHSAPDAAYGVARYGLMQLDDMKLPPLRSLAKELGLKGYSKLKKDELVELIYRSDENLR